MGEAQTHVLLPFKSGSLSISSPGKNSQYFINISSMPQPYQVFPKANPNRDVRNVRKPLSAYK